MVWTRPHIHIPTGAPGIGLKAGYYNAQLSKLKVYEGNSQNLTLFSIKKSPLHRSAFCHFTFRWIYYYGSNKSTGKETGKTHLCALHCRTLFEGLLLQCNQSSILAVYCNNTLFFRDGSLIFTLNNQLTKALGFMSILQCPQRNLCKSYLDLFLYNPQFFRDELWCQFHSGEYVHTGCGIFKGWIQN